MRIIIDARITPTRDGVSARSELLGLVGSGSDEHVALARLRRVAEAWCAGLLAVDKLEGAVRAKGIQMSPEGEMVTIELTRIDVAKASA